MVVALYGGTAVAYSLALTAHLAYAFRSDWANPARWSTRVALALHSVSLVTLVAQTGRAPVFSLFEAAFGLAWVLIFVYSVGELTTENQAAGLFVVPVVFLLVGLALVLPKPGPAEPALGGLPASLIFWHVSVTLLGYIFFMFGFITGAMYLALDHLLRRKTFHPVYYRLPSLETLDIWSYRFIATGFPLLSLGLLLGMLFAQLAWAEVWGMDPKVIWTVLTWLVYAGYLLMRRFYGWGGRRAAWWSIAGFLGIIVNYFIINTLVSKLHRFGV